MRRTVLSLSLAVMVLLAGCSGLGGSDTETEPAGTESPTTGMESPTSDSPGDEPSPSEPVDNPRETFSWVSESGVNESLLFRTHALTVSNESSYATRATYRIIAQNSPNETVRKYRFEASTAQNRARYVTNITRRTSTGTQVSNTTRYRELVDGTDTIYYRLETGSSVEYRSVSEPARNFSTFYRQLTGYDRTTIILQFELTYDQPVERGGQTLYRLTGDSFANGTSLAGGASNASATVLVSDRGVIRSLEYAFDGTSGGTPIRLVYSFETTGLGATSVDRPGWLDEAESS